MKPITALMVAMLSGVATYAVQNVLLQPTTGAARVLVPGGQDRRDWRQGTFAEAPRASEFDRALRRGVWAAHECRVTSLRIGGGAAIAMAIARPLAP
jgi:hypothetical protein